MPPRRPTRPPPVTRAPPPARLASPARRASSRSTTRRRVRRRRRPRAAPRRARRARRARPAVGRRPRAVSHRLAARDRRRLERVVVDRAADRRAVRRRDARRRGRRGADRLPHVQARRPPTVRRGRSIPRTRRSRTTTSPATPTALNSVLDTPDSGRGHLVDLGPQCSTALGNCRDVTAYLPPGYDAPAAAATTYPVLFMHDGQNVWDDHTAASATPAGRSTSRSTAEIAAGKVAPIIVIAADKHDRAQRRVRPRRRRRWTRSCDFQVHAAPAAARSRRCAATASRSRSPAARSAGWSSMELALRYPDATARSRRCRARSGRAWTTHPRCATSCRRSASSRSRSTSTRGGATSRQQRRRRGHGRGPRRARHPRLAARRLAELRAAARTRSATTSSPARPMTSWPGRPAPGGSSSSCSPAI